MAGHNVSDPFEIPADNYGYSNDDFEKVEAPSSGTGSGLVHYEQDPVDSLLTAGHRQQSANQDTEVSTTSDSASKPGSWLKGVDPRGTKTSQADQGAADQSYVFKDLIYWRDVKKTGLVFGSMLLVLLSLAIFSLVSVLAYLSLAVLVVTFSFVIYKKIMAAVQKSNEGHPFKPLLDLDITLQEEKLRGVIQAILKNINCTIKELRRLFLIEDTFDSLKFGLLLWALTYLGSWFNGITLIIIDLILLFTVPKVYETYQVQIDSYIDLAKTHIGNVVNIIRSKVPFLKKKEKTQ